MKLLAKSKLLNPYPPKGPSMKSHNMKGIFFSLKYFICRMVCKVYQTFNIMNKMLSYSSIKKNKENTTPMYQWTMLRLMFDSKVFWD